MQHRQDACAASLTGMAWNERKQTVSQQLCGLNWDCTMQEVVNCTCSSSEQLVRLAAEGNVHLTVSSC